MTNLFLYMFFILLKQTLALQRYTCQLARLHIDMYIYDMLQKSSILRSVTTETMVTGERKQSSVTLESGQ